jgi:beta-glucosidase
MHPVTIPSDFTFGASTSAYQIEGGRGEGGKGESIWDRFSDEGRLADVGDVACDHYHRFPEDVALMADLGIDAYRFSFAWTRLQPSGRGAPNREGIAFYRRLLTELADAGITPWATMYHWDLPQALQDDGGWAVRSTAEAFAQYAALLVDVFGDLVDNWITINEPWVAAFLGHVDGVFAPGITNWQTGLSAGHHLMLGHGLAVERIRTLDPSARAGIAIDCRPCYPASESDADATAARHFDGYRNRWFFDPVFGQGYPSDMIEAYRRLGRLPDRHPVLAAGDDVDVIAGPLDFLGLNYYTSLGVSAGASESEPPSVAPDATEMGWAVTPDALTTFLERIDRTWKPASIAVTENGAAYADTPDEHGVVHDRDRIDYLDRHIDAVADAIAAGVPVEGYFVWSLLDNLEWVEGFSKRFGLVRVERDTLRRVPKESFSWYRQRIASSRHG